MGKNDYYEFKPANPHPPAPLHQVSEGSPAATAGVLVGDSLCRFGPLCVSASGDKPALTAIAEVSVRGLGWERWAGVGACNS